MKANHEEVLEILQKNRQYFSIKKPFNESIFDTNINFEMVGFVLNKITDQRIKEYIRTTNAKRNGKFYFPAGNYFSDQYIIARRLLEDPLIEQYIISEIKTRLTNYQIKPDIILTCTHTGREIAALLSESSNIKKYTYFKNYYFSDSEHPVLPIKSSDNVLILTDVIGSGNLFKRLVKYVKRAKANIVGYCALVDTRAQHNNPRSNNVIILADIPFEKYKDRPSCWPENEIETIDPQKLIPIISADDIKTKALLNIDKFWEIVTNTNALKGEHIYNRGRHYKFYIDNKTIFQDLHYGNFLVKEILESLTSKIDVVLYPSHSDAEFLVERLYDYFPNFTKNKILPKLKKAEYIENLLGYEYNLPKTSSYSKDFKNSNVLIIDDGINTGKTIDELINISTSYGASNISIYVFLNRLSTENTRKYVEKLKMSKIPILFNYFYWLNFPVYNEDNCPYCKQLRLYNKSYLNLFTSSISKDQINDRIQKLMPTTPNEAIGTTSDLVHRARLIENQYKTSLESIIDNFHDSPDKDHLFNFLVEESNKIVSERAKNKLINLCLLVINGDYQTSSKTFGCALQTLAKLNHNKFIPILPKLISHIDVHINNYIDILISIEKILDDDIRIVESLQGCFRNISDKSGQQMIHHIQSDSKFIKWSTVDRYLYHLRQDLIQLIPLDKKDTISEIIIYLKNKIKPSNKIGHIPLSERLRKLKLVISRFIDNMGGNKKKYFKELKDIASNWEQQDLELRKILINSQKIYSAGDLAPNIYFQQKTINTSMKNDLHIIHNFMNNIANDKIILKNINDNISETYASIKRLYEKIFNESNSLHIDIKAYFNDLNKIFFNQKSLLDNFKKKNIEVIAPDKDDKYIILFDELYLNMLIHNLLFDSLRHGFRNLLDRNINQIKISITTEGDYVILNYHDNGNGLNIDDFNILINDKSKTWGTLANRIARYGGHLSIESNAGEGVNFCITFIGE